MSIGSRQKSKLVQARNNPGRMIGNRLNYFHILKRGYQKHLLKSGMTLLKPLPKCHDATICLK